MERNVAVVCWVELWQSVIRVCRHKEGRHWISSTAATKTRRVSEQRGRRKTHVVGYNSGAVARRHVGYRLLQKTRHVSVHLVDAL